MFIFFVVECIFKLTTKLVVILQLFVGKLCLSISRVKCKSICIGDGYRIYGKTIINIHKNSVLKVGSGLTLRNCQSSNSLGVAHPCVISITEAGAKLVIGDNVGMSGVSISCREYIKIGDRACIGTGVIILDNDCHPLDPGRRHNEESHTIRSSPVSIGDDVFIGARVIILKGVIIGEECIIQAGSVVVSGEYPAGSVLAGNPAQIISCRK